ncbi:MAG: AraC family transcriptional regulator [Clostridia bacterium]
MNYKNKMSRKNKFHRYIMTRLLIVAFILTSIFLVLQIRDRYDRTRELIESTGELQALESSRIIDQRIKTAINILTDAVSSDEVKTFLMQRELDAYNMLIAQNRLSKTVNLLDEIELSFAVYNGLIDKGVSNSQSFTLDEFMNVLGVSDVESFEKFMSQEISFPSFYETTKGEKVNIICSYKPSYTKDAVLFIIFDRDSLLDYVSEYYSLFDFEIIVSDNEPSDFLTKSTVSNDLYYNGIFQTKIYNTFIQDNILSFIIIIMFLIPLCTVLVVLSTNKIYKPIKEILKIAGATSQDTDKVGIFDEIEYIKRHVNVSNNNLSSKEIVLKEILYGIHKDDIDEVISKNHLSQLNSNIYFLYITIKNDASTDILSVQYIKFILQDIIRDVSIINVSDLGYVVLIQDLDREEIIKHLNELPHTFEDFYIIISKISDIYNINKSFFHINELIKSHSIGNAENIFIEENILVRADEKVGFTSTHEKILVYHIGQKNKSEYINTVNKVLNIALETYSRTKNDKILVSLADTLNRLNPKLNIKQEIFDAISSIDNNTELKTVIIGLFLDYYDLINEENLTNDIKYEFLEFIKNNYDQDISLIDLAENFNLSMNYVGVLFKEKTGENFKSYLNTYRMNIAKQIMLDNPNIKIKDLSVAVGFANINSFIRVFKEQEGISPGQYQKLNVQ